ncbi:hypothetical protein A3F37_04455 [Candidatus Saccharibacteria bacterium RIFCSPHIGHO2_12_FULL_41_12]|nr:MAG: hypothetical protein A3F37_04455 [Candidatus Saccharibacteria bacterium RIFCSPHIGHO2_12_FULL_41_12]
MDSTWFEINVMILSIMLGIFLIVGIATGILIYKIAKETRALIQQTMNVADQAEKLATNFAKSAAPLAFVKFLYNLRKDKKNEKS